jgi:hypothetical protein
MPRAEKKYHFIYKTTNLLSGKYYIGMHSTDNLNDGYMGSGKRLRYSINKHGKENHKVEILEFFDTRKELAAREKEVVCLDEIAKEKCMNLKVGGEGGLGFVSLSACTKGGQVAGQIIKNRIKEDENFKAKYSKIASENMKLAHINGNVRYDGMLGKEQTIETRNKIGKTNSIKQAGKLNSQYGTCWITNGIENKKIKEIEFDTWLLNGWIKGRPRK